MNRTALRNFTMLLLLTGSCAGASLSSAQVQFLQQGTSYPQDFGDGPCPVPTEFDVGFGGGLCHSTGWNDISLYPHNPILSAEDICDKINASTPGNAIYVRLRSSNNIYTYFCDSAPPPATPGACVPYPGATDQPDGTCTSSCFCVSCSAGVEVRVKADDTVDFGGDPGLACTATPGPRGEGYIGQWLLSTPANCATFQDYANATCLTSTGLVNKGGIACNGPTGPGPSVVAGSPAAMRGFLNGSRACILSNGTSFCYSRQPGAYLSSIAKNTNTYCINGSGIGSSYKWWVDLNADFDINGDPNNPSATTGLGDTAGTLASNLAADISTIGSPGTTATPTSSGSNCFTITNTSNLPFNLWVAPVGGSFCGVTSAGCSYNPTISLVTGPISSVPVFGLAGKTIMILLFLLTTTVLVRRRLRIPIPPRTAEL